MFEENAKDKSGHELEAAKDYPNKRACVVPHKCYNLTPLPAWCSQDFRRESQHDQDSWPEAVMKPSFNYDSRLDGYYDEPFTEVEVSDVFAQETNFSRYSLPPPILCRPDNVCTLNTSPEISYPTLAEEIRDISQSDSEVTEPGAPLETEIEVSSVTNADDVETCYGTVSVKHLNSISFALDSLVWLNIEPLLYYPTRLLL